MKHDLLFNLYVFISMSYTYVFIVLIFAVSENSSADSTIPKVKVIDIGKFKMHSENKFKSLEIHNHIFL